jgi:hypothetical protein
MNENQENNVAEEVKQESDLKQETVKTFNEAKEKMKNINLKEEAEVGKGLLKKLWKNPIETIKEIANDKENKAFKTALLLAAVWAIIELATMILYYVTSKYAEFEFLPTLKATVAPILKVIAMTLAVYFVKNRAKDSISKLLTSVTVAYIPSIISSLLWILYEISSKMSTILTPVGGLLNVVSIVLMYNTVKALTNEEDETKAIKTFIKVEAVYYVILLAVSFLGISL